MTLCHNFYSDKSLLSLSFSHLTRAIIPNVWDDGSCSIQCDLSRSSKDIE